MFSVENRVLAGLRGLRIRMFIFVLDAVLSIMCKCGGNLSRAGTNLVKGLSGFLCPSPFRPTTFTWAQSFLIRISYVQPLRITKNAQKWAIDQFKCYMDIRVADPKGFCLLCLDLDQYFSDSDPCLFGLVSVSFRIQIRDFFGFGLGKRKRLQFPFTSLQTDS
jgi:hypothetical protein